MPKYYCDYCRSYLTHDSTSVRKSHLVGKNHVKFVADYYERQAVLLGKWDMLDDDDELISQRDITIDQIYGSGAPGVKAEQLSDDENEYEATNDEFNGNSRNMEKQNAKDSAANSTSTKNSSTSDCTTSENLNVYNSTEDFVLPPPPSLSSMPNPPPSVFRYSEHYVDNNSRVSKSSKSENKPKHGVNHNSSINVNIPPTLSNSQSLRSSVNNNINLSKNQRNSRAPSNLSHSQQFNQNSSHKGTFGQSNINKQGYNNQKQYSAPKNFSGNQGYYSKPQHGNQQGYKYPQQFSNNSNYSNTQPYSHQGYNQQQQQPMMQQQYNAQNNYHKYNKPKFGNQNFQRNNRGNQNNRYNNYNSPAY